MSPLPSSYYAILFPLFQQNHSKALSMVTVPNCPLSRDFSKQLLFSRSTNDILSKSTSQFLVLIFLTDPQHLTPLTVPLHSLPSSFILQDSTFTGFLSASLGHSSFPFASPSFCPRLLNVGRAPGISPWSSLLNLHSLPSLYIYR